MKSRKAAGAARTAAADRSNEFQPAILASDFYSRSALVVARELIGKFLVRRVAGGDVEIAGLIHETEAYVGPHDLACHASKGCTARTQVMFGPAGFWYVYLIYGIHWMLNVVTDTEDYPSAVLIRGAGNWDGPGKLTKALAIDKKLSGRPASPASGLWIEDRGYRPPRRHVQRTPRIGVEYAGDWAAKPYRFLLTPRSSTSQSSTSPSANDLPNSVSKSRRR